MIFKLLPYIHAFLLREMLATALFDITMKILSDIKKHAKLLPLADVRLNSTIGARRSGYYRHAGPV